MAQSCAWRLGPIALLLVAACGGAGPSVTRVVDGRPIEGRFMAPLAYELFLRGAIAEETGQFDEAIAAFERTAHLDPYDALVWTKIAESRCKKNMHDPRIVEALTQALRVDPEFGPALALDATCGASPQNETAVAQAQRAMAAEPTDAVLAATMENVIASRAHAESDARDRLVGLAVAHPTAGAWGALFQWGNAHADDVLSLMAAKQLAHTSAMWTQALCDRIKELAGDGALTEARALAAAVLDGPAPHLTDPLCARLAIDEALARGDRDAVTRRTARTHVALSEVAARSLVIGNTSIALDLATLVTSADPADTSARMVLAAAGEARGDLDVVARAMSSARTPTAVPSAAVQLVFARALQRAGAPPVSAPLSDLLGTDALLVPIAVDLVARSALSDRGLPPEARIELALRNDDRATLSAIADGDRRHHFAALVWTTGQETSTAVKTLGASLAARSPDDPLVHASLLRMLTTNPPPPGSGPTDPLVESALDLLRLEPTNPIAIASSLTVLAAAPPSNDLTRAKAKMAVVAVTPHEHQLLEGAVFRR